MKIEDLTLKEANRVSELASYMKEDSEAIEYLITSSHNKDIQEINKILVWIDDYIQSIRNMTEDRD